MITKAEVLEKNPDSGGHLSKIYGCKWKMKKEKVKIQTSLKFWLGARSRYILDVHCYFQGF